MSFTFSVHAATISVQPLISLVFMSVCLMCAYVCTFLFMCMCVRVHVCYAMLVFCCTFVCVFVCVCLRVGQGSRHAAVYRPAVPVNGGTADDTTAADGGGSEVAGTGGKAAGNTHSTAQHTHGGKYTHNAEAVKVCLDLV